MSYKVMFSNGTFQDRKCNGICVRHLNTKKEAEKELDSFRSLFHKCDYKVISEDDNQITVHLPYDNLFADGLRCYWIEECNKVH